MKVVILDPTYKKANPNNKRCVDIGIKKLQQRFEQYQKQGKTIDTVFNDDVIIHDIIGGFYVYKCRANNNQLRLLYTMTKNKLVVVSHYIKKSDEVNHNQTYIPHFERAVARMKGMN